jgi:catechol 2,3-dioxygenase
MAGLIEAARQGADGGETAWQGMPRGTVIGHVHLHVGGLGKASEFYGEALGFDRTVWNYPGALFFGAGGYHHHVGTNTWAGADATPPQAGDAQLLEWSLLLPDDASVAAAAESLARGGYRADKVEAEAGNAFLTRDPWNTALRIMRG